MSAAASSDSLRKRIASRRWAEECYTAADDPAAFAQRVAEIANPPKPDQPITDEEHKAIGRLRMPWGKHSGERVADVPVDYLAWLSDQRNDEAERFRQKIRRYLKHPKSREALGGITIIGEEIEDGP